MADLVWLNSSWSTIPFICGSGGLGAIITWVYYAKQLRHASEQLAEQKTLNAVQLEKMTIEIKKLIIEKELVERELANKKGTALQLPNLDQINKYSIQLRASRSFFDYVKMDPGIASGDILIKSAQAEQDTTSLQFGIDDATSVTTIIASAFYAGELAERLLHWMRESKSSLVLIQTPFHAVEVTDRITTQNELRKILLQALEP
jgi:hypothetical protein